MLKAAKGGGLLLLERRFGMTVDNTLQLLMLIVAVVAVAIAATKK
jgi:hypothetical protein